MALCFVLRKFVIFHNYKVLFQTAHFFGKQEPVTFSYLDVSGCVAWDLHWVFCFLCARVPNNGHGKTGKNIRILKCCNTCFCSKMEINLCCKTYNKKSNYMFRTGKIIVVFLSCINFHYFHYCSYIKISTI